MGIPTRVIAGYQLLRKEAGGHAWVEVQLNDKTWWPLDPGVDADTLPNLGYFPWGTHPNYQGHSQEEIDKLNKEIELPAKIYSFRKKTFVDSVMTDLKHSLRLDVLSRLELLIDQYRGL